MFIHLYSRVHFRQICQWDKCPTVIKYNGTFFKPMGHKFARLQVDHVNPFIFIIQLPIAHKIILLQKFTFAVQKHDQLVLKISLSFIALHSITPAAKLNSSKLPPSILTRMHISQC